MRKKGVPVVAAEGASAVVDDDADELTVKAPMPAKLVQFEVEVGDVLPAGAQLGVLEAMKMEHLLHAPVAGRVVALLAAPGDYLVEGQSLVRLEAVDAQAVEAEARAEHDLDAVRPDLQKVIDRHAPHARHQPQGGRRQAPRAGRPHRAREHRRPVRHRRRPR
jgi:pyruvate/2-oxoglutarate dehydrogenase complex dihydrolipoamide acyltransferase (E2) component